MGRQHRPEDLLAHQLVAGVVGLHQRRLHEVAHAAVGAAALDDLRVPLRVRDVVADLRERLPVDHRAHEVAEVARVAHRDVLHHRHGAVAHLGPQALRHVDAAGRRALLALVFVGAAHHRHRHFLRVGRGVHHDEVLAAGLAHESRIRLVLADVHAHVFPHVLEHVGAAGEVDAAEIRRVHRHRAHRHRITGHEVDDARRQACRLEQLHRVVGAQHRRLRRLPHHRVAHHGRRRREVAADGREVERRHRVDETLERTVVALVPHRRRRQRLLGHQLGGERRVEAPEVHQLAGGVDLGLVHRLALVQHGGGVQRVAPRGGQQVRRLQEHGDAVFPRPARPFLLRLRGRRDRRLHVFRPRVVPARQHVAVLVRHHRRAQIAGADLLAADDERDVDDLARHRGEPFLQRRLLGRPRAVRLDGLVDGRENLADTGKVGGHVSLSGMPRPHQPWRARRRTSCRL